MARWIFTLICGCVMAFLIGCASPAKTHIVKIQTMPPDAEVIVDGASSNTTPTEVVLPLDGKDHYLFITKEGCDEVRKVLNHDHYPDNLILHLNCH
jgi:PEGA domain